MGTFTGNIQYRTITDFITNAVSIHCQPFVEDSSFLRGYFPDPIYAIAIPATVLVISVFFVAVFVGIVFIREAKKAKIKTKTT